MLWGFSDSALKWPACCCCCSLDSERQMGAMALPRRAAASQRLMHRGGGQTSFGHVPERAQPGLSRHLTTGGSTVGSRPRISRVVAFALEVVSLLGAGGAFLFAFATSFCGLFGDTCSPGEEATITIAMIGSLVLAFGGPLLVARLRRSWGWALPPVVIVGFLVVISSVQLALQ